MTDASEPDAPEPDAPEPVVDLLVEGRRLVAAARDGGRAQVVRLAFGQPGQRSLLIGLPRGGGLPDHDAPGPASLLCLEGEVVLASSGVSWTLPAGSGRVIPRARHEVSAVVDSICLLTVSID